MSMGRTAFCGSAKRRPTGRRYSTYGALRSLADRLVDSVRMEGYGHLKPRTVRWPRVAVDGGDRVSPFDRFRRGIGHP